MPVKLTYLLTMFCKVTCLLLTLTALQSCTSYDQKQLSKAITSNDPEKAIKQYAKNKSRQYQQSPESVIHDINQLNKRFKELKNIIESIWGKDNSQLPSKKKYVKYTNKYQSKALVDFEQGHIIVETIATKEPIEKLQKAIVTTLLTSENPANTDIFSDKSPTLQGKPYLLGQVVDQDNKAIEYQWRANRFAQYLITKQLKQKRANGKTIHYVEIAMVNKHQQLRKNKYANYVLASANRYQIKPELIFAVIETESSFNPFAVSSSNAYGLMQIMPQTAGKDVYQRILKKSGVPSKQTLFKAEQNIEIGTAYLHILEQQYLKTINSAQSKHYAMISAYNGGAGNVFKTFDSNRSRAAKKINKLTSMQVFNSLTKRHPRAETRRYLSKVSKAEKRYQQ